MAGRIPENVLEDILSKIDIVELISGFFPLKRAGRNFKACCPFHHEKTPSFIVSPDRQIYHCFGCGESGNAFRFLMRYERMDFPEAVETLAKRSGVVIPELRSSQQQQASGSIELYRVVEAALTYYCQNLDSAAGSQAKKYLLDRGVTPESISSFKLGLALNKWDGLLAYLRGKGFSLSSIERAGLILAKESGGYYDRFRNRVLFPITDIKGRCLGFGGRLLEGQAQELAKYLNSPETPIYTKGRHLYGMASSRDYIRDSDCALVVEGYLDYLLPFQHGIRNIVASLGTALTLEQVRLLKRYSSNVIMVYDPDEAGQIATLRSLDIFVEEEMQVRIASLPKGLDPDLFVRKHGPDAFKKRMDEAASLFDYKLGVLKSAHNHKTIEGKARISSLMLETIVKIKNEVLRSEYIRKLAQELDVREEALIQQIKKIKAPSGPAPQQDPTVRASAAGSSTERLLLKLMLEETELVSKIRECVEPADFRDELAGRVAGLMFELEASGRRIEASALMNYFDSDEMSQIIGESVFLPDELSRQDKEEIVVDCIRRLKEERVKSRRHQLHEEIKKAQEAGDNHRMELLMSEFQSLIRKG